jgi:hypothetical protein
MAMPMGEFGDVAARLLEAQIATNGERDAVRRMYSAELVVRASTLGHAATFQ